MRKFTLAFIGSSLVFTLATTPVMAADLEVKNPTVQTGQVAVSNIRIDGVDAPKAGKKLDCSAIVRTKEGYSWEIAVIWLTKDGKVATIAKEGETYFPTLAFYVPPKYRLTSDSFKVSLSDALTKLLGSKDIISVFDSSTGLTFILPPTISSVSTGTDATAATNAITGVINSERTTRWNNAATTAQATTPAAPSAGESSSNESNSEDSKDEAAPPKILVDLFCAQTAKDAINEQDLTKLAEFVIGTLQPQAVNLLINSFPAFKKAAENDEIGKEIGLYIYYQKGDDDGHPEHKTVPGSLAYVAGDAAKFDDELKYGYVLALDVDDLTKKDKDKNPIRDESTGKISLDWEGDALSTLNNTIVHEMFHAFMDDYNRTGMVGVETLEETLDDGKGNYLNPESGYKCQAMHYPYWFVEGTASTVENNLQFRKDNLDDLRAKPEGGSYYAEFTNQCVLDNYLSGKASDGTWNYYDLENHEGIEEEGKKIDPYVCRYFTGYLATIYLSEIAYQSITQTPVETYTFTGESSARYRDGLSYILEQMHNGATLDEVISSISPVVATETGTEKLYSSTAEFQKEFIKGPELKDKPGYYSGDGESLNFVTSYCNYMLSLEKDPAKKFYPNGSILFDLDDDYNIPLDPEKETTSDYFKIVDSNCYVVSTVSPDKTVIGGGKSKYVPAPADDSTSLQEEAQQAAKSTSGKAEETTEETQAALTEAATEEVEAAEAVQNENVNEEAKTAQTETATEANETEATEDVAEANLAEDAANVAETATSEDAVQTEDTTEADSNKDAAQTEDAAEQ